MSIEFLEIHRRKEVSNMKTTGEKIRDLRLNLGLTQAELAEMTGITVRSITNYETDAATPRRLQLRKLCEALNTTEDYLLKPEIDDPAYGLYLLVAKCPRRIRTCSSRLLLRRTLSARSRRTINLRRRSTANNRQFQRRRCCTEYWTVSVVR